ncbi:aldehyde dehydrogenase family protein, partial [Rhodococcus sp. NPDC127530]
MSSFPVSGELAARAAEVLARLGADAPSGPDGPVVSRSPINGEVIGRLQASTAREVDDAITSAA